MLQDDSKKCVLSICDISPNKFGSFEEFIVSLTSKLKENNFEHIVIFRDKPIKNVEGALLKSGAKIKIIKPSKSNIYNFITFYKIIERIKPEIVHFHFYPVYTVVNYLKFCSNIKIVYTDHMGIKAAKTNLKKIVRHAYYCINSKFFDFGIDKIVCVSNYVKSKYPKEYGINSTKLHVIYNGINTDRFQKKYETKKIKEKFNIKNEYVVTCVGLRKDKGAHYLIEAAPTIIRKYPNIRFLLVGEDEYKNNLKKRINELNIKTYFKFTGNTDSIEEIYSISSCVVIPTLVEEAFCFVAAEAMSTETPVIAFDSGAVKEILYNKENIIPRTSKDLAAKIIECLKKDKILINDTRTHVVKNFSLDRSTCNYIKLYKDLLITERLNDSVT